MDIVRVAGIMHAGPGDLTFLANAKYAPQLAATRASAVIVANGNGGAPRPPCPVLLADDPYSAFAHAVALFASAGSISATYDSGMGPTSAELRGSLLGALAFFQTP